MSETDVVIVGAGLSGLSAGLLLRESGKSVRILEASEDAGGRIRSVRDTATGAFVADLGPSWVWPAHQPVIKQWLSKLQLPTVPQFSEGRTLLDHGPGQHAQAGFFPSQEDNERVAGGSQALIDALAANLPDGVLETNRTVEAVEIADGRVLVSAGQTTVTARTVVVAVPLRIAASTIEWSTPLPPALMQALAETPTWMAPHAKVAIVYDEAFWRGMGLSGRIVSRAGPLVEAHDHCGPDGHPAALWGFIGWPYETRQQAGADLETHIRQQLRRCFGDGAPEPVSIHVEDWANNQLIAAPADLAGPMAHPSVRPDIVRQPHFEGRLLFAGAESALRSPGLIEGAFDAANRAAALVAGREKTDRW